MPVFQNLAQRHPRIASALWFGCAGISIPVSIAIASGKLLTGDFTDLATLFLLPFCSACIAGALLGHRIITMNDTKASGRGMLVAACALLLFAVFFSVLISEKRTTDRDGDVAGALITVLPMLIVPVMVAGGGAGWLLYRLTRDETAERQTMAPP